MPIIDCIKDNTKDYTGQYSKEKFNGHGFGPNTRKMCGFPHFENVEFDGEFPNVLSICIIWELRGLYFVL